MSESPATKRCPLCGNPGVLQDSHLLPRALDKLCRAPEKENPNPVVLTPNRTIKISRQVRDRLLCLDCEKRLNRQGEDWVMEHCHRSPEEFKLRTVLKETKPVYVWDDCAFYMSLQNDKINTAALVYFAASVFWRAAVHPWRSDAIIHIELGPYAEAFRKYLIGKDEFPQNAVLWAGVSGAHQPATSVNFPHARKRTDDFHSYNFHIPGIYFDLFVGNSIPQSIRHFCAARLGVIYVSERVDRMMRNDLLTSFKGAARYLAKYELVSR